MIGLGLRFRGLPHRAPNDGSVSLIGLGGRKRSRAILRLTASCDWLLGHPPGPAILVRTWLRVVPKQAPKAISRSIEQHGSGLDRYCVRRGAVHFDIEENVSVARRLWPRLHRDASFIFQSGHLKNSGTTGRDGLQHGLALRTQACGLSVGVGRDGSLA